MIEGGWDHAVVGAGTAGCALANRLGADPSNPVLLLGAGVGTGTRGFGCRSDSSRPLATHATARPCFVPGRSGRRISCCCRGSDRRRNMQKKLASLQIWMTRESARGFRITRSFTTPVKFEPQP